MANLLPQCTKYGSPVTDSLEDEIEQHEKNTRKLNKQTSKPVYIRRQSDIQR